MKDDEIILEAKNLKKWFTLTTGFMSMFTPKKSVKAVDDISFKVKTGEIFGLIGESGCGKTTTGRLVLRLIEPTDGKVYFEGEDIFSMDNKKLLEYRRKAQIIFQDPFGSLSPRSTILGLVSEPLVIHKICNKSEVKKRVIEILDKVGLPTTQEFLTKRPVQLSGGQRQRVAIARCLILGPKFLVADEPVSMLDASIRGSLINLMLELRDKFNVTYLFITHELSVAWHMCDRIAVMYLGKIVESGPIEDVIKSPKHPYTQALMVAVPTLDTSQKFYLDVEKKIRGYISSSIYPPSGCRFHPRCPYAIKRCSEKEPELIEIKKDHEVACFSD